MRQTLHILKKDLRHLWREIALVLVLLAAFTYVKQGPIPFYSPLGIAWDFLIPLSWGLLIARAIHSEALAGDRQFWLTRPYSRASLFAAKLLLFLLAITIPLTISHIVILRMQGFTIAGHVADLVLSQALWFLGTVVSFAALAAITTGLTSVALTYLLAIGLSVVFQGIFLPEIFLDRLQWIPDLASRLVSTVPAIAILIWMFTRRRIFAGRLLYGAALLASVLVTFIPFGPAFAMQERFSKQQVSPDAIQPEIDLSVPPIPTAGPRERPRQFVLPLRFRNLPSPDATLRSDGAVASIKDAQGRILWEGSSLNSQHGVLIDERLQEFLTVDPQSFGQVTSQPVRIHTLVYLTVFGGASPTTILPQNQTVEVAGIGICSLGVQDYGQYCRSAFGPPRAMVLMSGAESYTPSYEPFRFSPDLSPVVPFGFTRLSPVTSEIRLTTKERLAHIRREFDIDLPRLADYQTAPLP